MCLNPKVHYLNHKMTYCLIKTKNESPESRIFLLERTKKLVLTNPLVFQQMKQGPERLEDWVKITELSGARASLEQSPLTPSPVLILLPLTLHNIFLNTEGPESLLSPE